MPPPPPPPPPPPSGPPPPSRSGIGAKSSNNAKGFERNALLGQIQKGTKLKKAETNDRSAPIVGNNKNSSAKKYNTIGVHSHRQQPQHHHPQQPGPALWRRGSQDDCSALLKQREKILEKKNKASATSVTTTSPPPPPAPDADFLNNILNASAAMKARANKRPMSAGSGNITRSAPLPAANSLTRGNAIKKGPTKVETHKANIGPRKPVPRATDSSVGAGRMQSNISKVNANINSLNKASSSIGNMTKAAANLNSTSKGFSTVGKKKELNISGNASKNYSVSSSNSKFNSASSQSAKLQSYSSSSDSTKFQTYSSSSDSTKFQTYSSSSEPSKFQTYSTSSESTKFQTYSSSSESTKFQTYSSPTESTKFQTYSSPTESTKYQTYSSPSESTKYQSYSSPSESTKFQTYSSPSESTKYQTYSSPTESTKSQSYSISSEPAKYTNIDHMSYSRNPTYNNNTEEILTVSSDSNTNLDISLQNKTIQYSNIKSQPRARYGNVEESGRWITNFKKKVSRLSTLPFPAMSSSKSSFEVSHSDSSYISSSSTLPTDYSNQQQANLRMVKNTSSSYVSNDLQESEDAANRLVKLRKVPQRQLLTPTKTYTRPQSSPSRIHEWRRNLRKNASNFRRFSATRLNVRQPGTPRHRSAAMSHYRPAAMTQSQPCKFSIKSGYQSNTRTYAADQRTYSTTARTYASAPRTYTVTPSPPSAHAVNTNLSYSSAQVYSPPKVEASQNMGVYENYLTPYPVEPVTFSRSTFYKTATSCPDIIELEKTNIPPPKVASFQEVTLKQTKFSGMLYGKKDETKQFTPFARYMKASYGNPPSSSTYWNWGERTDARSEPVSSSKSQSSYFRPFGCSFFRPSFVTHFHEDKSEDYRQKSASAPSLVQSRIQWAINVSDNVEGSPSSTGKVADIRQETVRSLVRDRINSWGNNLKDDGNKQSSGPVNSRGPGSPGGPSPLSKSCGGGIGELFPGGVPKLPKAGLKQRSTGNLSPKPIRSVKNGPTTQGERTPPPNRNVQNGVEINRVMPAKPSLANRPKPPPAPPTTPPTGINNNINVTNNNNNNNLNFSQTHTSGGLPLNMSRRMPGSHPPPPPPPSRPPALPSNRPTAPKNRPNSMIGRPLPPTPTSSSSSSSSLSSSSLNRNLPPLPSNKAPQPPERTVSTGGSLPRTRAPTHKPPPPQRPPPGQRPPPPPPARPPSGPAQPLIIHDGPVPPQRSSSNCSIGSLDLEKRGHFHSVHEFPPAEPFTGCPKTYPSQSAKNSAANRRAPPPPPPPTGVSIAR